VRNSAAGAYLAVAAIAGAIYVAIGGSYLLYQAFGLSAVLAILAGVVLHRPRAARAWLTLAAAQATFALGDFFYFTVYGGRPPYPGLPDVLYLSGDVVFLAALVLLIRGRGAELLSYIDAVVVALGAGLILWAVFFDDVTVNGSAAAQFVSLGYPAFDLALLAGLVHALFAVGTKTRSYALTLAGVVVLILGDAWYVAPVLTSHYVFGTWRDLGWLGSYALVGAAALHPSMTRFVDERRRDQPLRRIVALVLSLGLVVVAAALERAVEGAVHIYVFAIVGGTMAVFTALRVGLLVRALERTRHAAEESERKFRMVFERAPIGISIGRDGLMSETNPALQRMLGYTHAEIAPLHYLDITHPDDRGLALQHELDARVRRAFSVDKRYVRKDGSTIDAHVHVALDLDDGLGISLIEDVSERRALEQQLRQSQKMEAVGKLAGGIAHDFNNLMTAVIGYSDLMLRDSTLSEAQTARVHAIRGAATRAGDLTRQLLAFSRRQVLQAAELDLRDVVAGMDDLLRRLLGEDIRFETIFGSEDLVVRADRGQLEQVVLNLVVNARDAVAPGGSITVAVLSAGDEAVLAVSDDGVGMDADIKARIFEPFFTTKGLAEGSGLGLATVHGIVGQSGGTIDVDSTPGAGTVFTVRLPLAAEPEVPERVVASGLPVGAPPATLVD
jgi:PAS domain S-box-containing protein